MFRSLFKKRNDDDIFEVDPVIEQRRKEKFSTPLIYDEEFKEEAVVEPEPEPIPVAVPEEKEIPKPKLKPRASETKVVIEDKPKAAYQMREVISPMNGVTKKKSSEPVTKTKKTNKPKKKKNIDQLVPVISPFFGNYDEKPVITSNAKLTPVNEESSVKKEKKISAASNNTVPTVEENLRNIAKIIEEEKDQLKIIEERTGEFKLDFSAEDAQKKNTLIDNVDDDMSMNELMNLYEKFKDD